MEPTTPSSLSSLVLDALHQPAPAISYYVSQQLAALYPGAYVLMTADSDFNFESYAGAGECALAVLPAVLPQQTTYWNGVLQELWDSAAQILRQARWQEQTIDLLQMSWSEGGCASSICWVIAEREALARDFFRAVCAWNSKVEDE